MLLDLKKIFSQESESCSFDYSMDLSSTGLNGVFPFVSPVAVKGIVESRDGSARLKANVSFDFSIPCDRCTERIDRHYDFAFSHVLVRSLENNEDDDRFIEVRDEKLDLDKLMREDILLELPTKFLCSDDCRGLCPICGKNLNEGPCDCGGHPTDPRLEVLEKLLH
ncbi:YceD family protein [Caproicibacter sp.]|uniref:YceD family protein n=1 Tax=Caproicibacter sp. TaxID=2814884 RepID=UPI003988D6CA